MMNSGEKGGLQKKLIRQAKWQYSIECYTFILLKVEADAYIKEHFGNTIELAIQGELTKSWYDAIYECTKIFETGHHLMPLYSMYVIVVVCVVRCEDHHSCLALIIVLDQFTRNVYRNNIRYHVTLVI